MKNRIALAFQDGYEAGLWAAEANCDACIDTPDEPSFEAEWLDEKDELEASRERCKPPAWERWGAFHAAVKDGADVIAGGLSDEELDELRRATACEMLDVVLGAECGEMPGFEYATTQPECPPDVFSVSARWGYQFADPERWRKPW